MAQGKPRIMLEIEEDGNISMVTNMTDNSHVHATLKLAADLLVARALQAYGSEPKMIVPAHSIPKSKIS